MRMSDWSADMCSADLRLTSGMSDSATAAEGDAAEAGADIGSIDYRVEPPSPGGHIFLFQETEHPEGGIPRTIAFRDVTVVPRGYEELIATKPDKAGIGRASGRGEGGKTGKICGRD